MKNKRLIPLLIILFLAAPLSGRAQAPSDHGFAVGLRDIRTSILGQLKANPIRGRRFAFEILDPIQGKAGQQVSEEAKAIFKMAAPTVLTVKAGRGQGSAFIIDPKGIAITNAHVVQGNKEVTVELNDGRTFKATVLAVGPGRDLAILEIISDIKDWPALPLGSTANMSEGSLVYALGNPTGLGLSFSRGMVSRQTQAKLNYYTDYIQSDIQISQGNSGGPLLDHTGKVVGVNTAIAGTGGRIGMSVKVETLKSTLLEWRTTGKILDGYVGMAMHPASGHEEESSSPLIRLLTSGSEAEKSGLKIGDTIVSVDGKPLAGDDYSANEFTIMRAVAKKKPGETVRLGIRRAIPVTLGLTDNPNLLDAQLIPGENVVLLAPGVRGFLMAASFGNPLEIHYDSKTYAVEVEDIGQNYAFAIFRVDPAVAGGLPAGKIETVDLKVEAFPVPEE